MRRSTVLNPPLQLVFPGLGREWGYKQPNSSSLGRIH